MLRLAERGVEAIRINCAHDDADAWQRMINHRPRRRTGHRPPHQDPDGHRRPEDPHRQVPRCPKAASGSRSATCSRSCRRAGSTTSISTSRISRSNARWRSRWSAPRSARGCSSTTASCACGSSASNPGACSAASPPSADNGLRLKPEKGLNFPDTPLEIPALTAKDRADLDFVAGHADGVEFSFVQSVDDVETLQAALAERRPHDWQKLSLVLKIETPEAVANLPDIVVQAAGRQPTAIMIARGDLAVEIGFARLAEMQEEILWIGEAAHVPVIWATQVLEHLVKKGTPSRGEMTDAAMAARAECVMLNKGPYLFKAITELDTLLARMDGHQHKKTPQLRALRSWDPASVARRHKAPA